MKKNIVKFLCILLLPVSMNAQKLSIKQTEALEKEADLEKIKGEEYVMEFILKRDTNLFNLATTSLKSSFTKYNRIMKDGTADSYLAAAMGAIIQSKISLVQVDLSLYDDYFSKKLMKEPEEQRKKKIEYNGIDYKVSSDSKKTYNNLKDQIKTETKH